MTKKKVAKPPVADKEKEVAKDAKSVKKAADKAVDKANRAATRVGDESQVEEEVDIPSPRLGEPTYVDPVKRESQPTPLMKLPPALKIGEEVTYFNTKKENIATEGTKGVVVGLYPGTRVSLNVMQNDGKTEFYSSVEEDRPDDASQIHFYRRK